MLSPDHRGDLVRCVKSTDRLQYCLGLEQAVRAPMISNGGPRRDSTVVSRSIQQVLGEQESTLGLGEIENERST